MSEGELIPKDLFKAIAGQWLTGVTVVTSVDEQDRPVGLTMNAVAPLSLSPPMFLISLDCGSDTLRCIQDKRAFCINFLSAGQGGICGIFARKGDSKFDDVEYHVGTTGVPVIEGVIAHVECIVHDISPRGDHAIVTGNAIAGTASGGEPLVYFTSAFRALAPCS